MASSPTTRNRFNKQAQGDSIDAWGTVLNTGVFDLVDDALDGVTSLAITGNVTLTSSNYAADQARKRVLKLTGSPGASYIITVPSVEKFYIVHNATDAAQQLKAGGIAASVPSNTLSYVYCDGTDSFTPAATINTAIGTVVDFAGALAPSGWLLCYGQAISRTAYTALFQTIGTAHGVGDGSTTFNVPDLRGRASFGRDDMGGSAANRITGSSSIPSGTLGAAGGSELLHAHSHSVSISDPGHSHGTTQSPHSHGVTDPGHTHSSNAVTGSSNSVQGPGGTTAPTYGGGATINSVGTGISIQNANANITVNGNGTGITAVGGPAGSGSSQNMPPTIILNKIIYAGV